MNNHDPDSPSDVHPPRSALAANGQTRRQFVTTVAVTAAGTAIFPSVLSAAQGVPRDDSTAVAGGAEIDLTLSINGEDHAMKVDPRLTLLDALRDKLSLTGSKKGCDHGQCGACTVLVDGRRINSCLTLAVMHSGSAITTIEGLAKGDELHPVQAAFVEHDGFQCGYCTPGQICSAVALLKENHARSDDEIREWMSGNICRCGAYTNIVAAIKEARDKTKATL
jgi:xanthine dehydrogenase YagT iron-sulfur-binding subunit